ncbi:MAG: methyltransferase domain-containing protein, partial [Deltaproteobacteria bacterium]|nr:methyltransferase domain-containing protein [Deltaproteobacteria bacterium]
NASKKYDSQNCVFRWFDGTIFPFDDETFNAVVSFQVIEHVKDDIQFLAEIYRVLKTGGQCLLTTPNRLFRVRPHKKPWNRFHIREYTPDTFEQVLKKIFLDVRVWGIRGSDEIQEIEKVRIRQIQKFVDIDPFNLRKLLPPKYETLIAKWGKKFLKKKLKSAPQKNYLQLYGVEDYFIIKNHIEESLDLLAFWEK